MGSDQAMRTGASVPVRLGLKCRSPGAWDLRRRSLHLELEAGGSADLSERLPNQSVSFRWCRSSVHDHRDPAASVVGDSHGRPWLVRQEAIGSTRRRVGLGFAQWNRAFRGCRRRSSGGDIDVIFTGTLYLDGKQINKAEVGESRGGWGLSSAHLAWQRSRTTSARRGRPEITPPWSRRGRAARPGNWRSRPARCGHRPGCLANPGNPHSQNVEGKPVSLRGRPQVRTHIISGDRYPSAEPVGGGQGLDHGG